MSSNEQLLLKISQGDKKAREELILKNLKFVSFVCKRVWNNPKEYEDLFEYGVLGLIKAVDAYKIGKVKFSTFAFVCIKNEILFSVRQNSKHQNSVVFSDPSLVKGYDDEVNFEELLPEKIDFDTQIEDKLTIEEIQNALDQTLTPHQAHVIKARYFTQEQPKQSEIAKQLGVTQSFCCRLEHKGINQLRKLFENVEN